MMPSKFLMSIDKNSISIMDTKCTYILPNIELDSYILGEVKTYE